VVRRTSDAPDDAVPGFGFRQASDPR